MPAPGCSAASAGGGTGGITPNSKLTQYADGLRLVSNANVASPFPLTGVRWNVYALRRVGSLVPILSH